MSKEETVDQEPNKETNEETNETVENTVEQTEELDPLVKLQSQYDELNDKFLRLFSEFDNFRKRTQKEKLDILKSGGSDMAKSILPVIDDFERAMKANESIDDIKVVKEGFTLIHSKFTSALQAKGLKKMELLGNEFNSDISEAIANVPVEDKKQKGKVIDEVEAGYYLNDIIIRFGKVVVGS